MTTHKKHRSILSKIQRPHRQRDKSRSAPLRCLSPPEAIAGFYPENKPGKGGGVTICLTDGSCHWLPLTVPTLLNHLADELLVNLRSLKNRLRSRLGVSYYLPLPLADSLVLVPVKTREALVKGDGVHGYVNACCVVNSQVHPPAAGSFGEENLPGVADAYLLLECGTPYPCLTSQKKVNDRFYQAQMALDVMR